MNKLVLTVALGLSLLSAPARADGFAGWIYAQPSGVLLASPTITPFDDGSALVIGDYVKKGEAQEYSSVTGEWAAVGTPLFPRVRHAAVGLPGGKVLLCGGAEFVPTPWYEDFTEPEIYDHASRTFTKTGEMSSPRIQPSAALSCDDRTEPLVLVTGGGNKWPDVGMDERPLGKDPGIILDSAQIYRLSTGQWESAPPMSTARIEHTATCIPGHGVLVVGGRGAKFVNPLNGPPARGLPTAELFDPVMRKWKPVASLHAARFAHTATLLSDGRVLVAGGTLDESRSRYLTSAELYDPETDQWTILPEMAVARTAHAQVRLANDRVLLAGGITFDKSGGCDDSGTIDSASPCRNSGMISISSVEVYEPLPGAGSAGGAAFRRAAFPSMILARSAFPFALLGGGTLLVASHGPVSKATEILPLSTDGVRCDQAHECRSGFCVDGVCCPGACDSACSACSAATGSPADGVCWERSCENHGSCTRASGSGPVCRRDCQSADQCEVGYACDPASHACVEPHSTFVSEGCAVAAPGAPPSGRWAWLVPALLALLAPILRRSRRAGQGRRLAWLSAALLALVSLGCDASGEEPLCGPFTQCGDSCVNTRADRRNCGACGTACGAAELCLDGTCSLACAGGASACGDSCVDLSVDPKNCGACGVACAGSHVCDDGACALPGGLRSYIFPGVHAAGGIHPKEPRFLLAAEGPATIHCTTDGSTPVPGDPGTVSGRSPLEVPPAPDAEGVSQRRIQWFADYDFLGPEAEVHSYLSVVDPQAKVSFGAMVQPAELAPDGGPIVVVAPGGAVKGAVEYAEWSSEKKGYCPTCIIQLYIGVEDVSQTLACDSYQGSAHTYPGKEGTFSFQGEAPPTPGRYAIRAWQDLGNSCDPSKAVTAQPEEVGLVVVH